MDDHENIIPALLIRGFTKIPKDRFRGPRAEAPDMYQKGRCAVVIRPFSIVVGIERSNATEALALVDQLVGQECSQDPEKSS